MAAHESTRSMLRPFLWAAVFITFLVLLGVADAHCSPLTLTRLSLVSNGVVLNIMDGVADLPVAPQLASNGSGYRVSLIPVFNLQTLDVLDVTVTGAGATCVDTPQVVLTPTGCQIPWPAGANGIVVALTAPWTYDSPPVGVTLSSEGQVFGPFTAPVAVPVPEPLTWPVVALVISLRRHILV